MPIAVKGSKELRAKIRAAKDKELTADLKAAHQELGQAVASRARGLAPRGPTGRLVGSIKSARRVSGAVVTAGGGRLVYVPVIHWGNPSKKGRLGVIRPQPFLADALGYEEANIVRAHELLVEKFAARLT